MNDVQVTITQQYSSQVSAFRRDGFCIVRGALNPAEVDRYRAECRAIMASPRPFDKKTKFLAVAQRSRAIASLVEHPAFFPLVVQLLQHYNIVLYTSQVISAAPSAERPLGWHTDGGQPQAIAVNNTNAMTSLKVGLFLTDALTPDCGSLEVMPGSQLHRLDWKLSSNAAIDRDLDRRDRAGAEQLHLAAGDAVVFDQRLWHCTAPNRSGRERIALYLGYAYGQLRPLDYSETPAWILEGCSPIAMQLLGHRASPFREYSFYSPEPEDVPLKAWYERHFGDTWI